MSMMLYEVQMVGGAGGWLRLLCLLLTCTCLEDSCCFRNSTQAATTRWNLTGSATVFFVVQHVQQVTLLTLHL
jgi:hypothetical protein